MFGEDYYQWERHKELENTYKAARLNNYPIGHSRGGRERWYSKGSLVLDMLRDILGDEEFGATMKFYLEEHPYQIAETNDLLQAIRKTTGRSLEWFSKNGYIEAASPFMKLSTKLSPRARANRKHESELIRYISRMH